MFILFLLDYLEKYIFLSDSGLEKNPCHKIVLVLEMIIKGGTLYLCGRTDFCYPYLINGFYLHEFLHLISNPQLGSLSHILSRA